MKEIPLTRGKIAVISDGQYEDVSKAKWYACYCRGKWYARRNAIIAGEKTQIYLHRYIGVKLGYDTNSVIDHIDGNGLNNQDENLRGATSSQNMANRKGWGKSAYKGVVPKGNRWVAQIRYSNETIYLGIYEKDIDAALAYDNKARELFGIYAETNFDF